MQLCCLSEFINSNASVRIGFAHSLSAVTRYRDLALRSSRRCLLAILEELRCVLSQACTPLRSFTTNAPQTFERVSPSFASLLLPRFRSLRRFSGRAEPHISSGVQPTGYVASSGFLNLSTPCSPRDLSGLFHPESVLGIHPSRLLPAAGAVRPLERRSLHEVSL